MAKNPTNSVVTPPSNPIKNPVMPLNPVNPNSQDTGSGTTPFLSTPIN